MKVLLVGNYAEDRQHSMQGFAGALLSGLLNQGDDTRLIAPRQVVGGLRIPQAGVRKWLGYVDKFALFPRELRRALCWADVVHICDQGNAIYTKYLSAKPHTVTCHDLLAIRSARGELPEAATGRSGRVYQSLILNGLKRGKYLVSDSQATQQDLLRICEVPAAKTRLLRLGLLYPYTPMGVSESAAVLRALRIAPEEPFLLHVGGNQFYKNRLGVLEIFDTLRRDFRGGPLRMVMAGKPFTDEMRQYLANQRLESHVTELSELTNEHLRALYSRARVLVFPSLYEGFGLPIIEAQACGCPVFTSNRAPMTEVGGEAAGYFDPAQPEQAAQIIAERLDNTDAMIKAGFENIQRFSTARMLQDYRQVYRHVLGGSAEA